MLRLAVSRGIGALLFTGLSLAEASFVSRAGTDALATVALVVPLIILAGMFSAGTMGEAINSFAARATGAGDSNQAEALLVCAVLISVIGGLLM